MLFKLFVVTNCSKDRPGSIVTETLKNIILIPIVTSNVEFCIFFFQKADHGCVFIFFPRGDSIDPVVLECRKWAHSTEN